MTPPAYHRQLWSAIRNWWQEQSLERGSVAASTLLAHELWIFLRDSTPERQRRRYGDMEYDWEYRVNTTSGSVGWRERLLGVFHSPYQPTDAALFKEMMARLPIDFSEFTFVDLGSGKGRTLLMASEYPFRRIVGVEILPELHEVAQENLSRYKNESQKCRVLDAICGDAIDFAFPLEPLVLFLFNPLSASGLRRVLSNLDKSLNAYPRAVYLLYHNPLQEHVLNDIAAFSPIARTQQYSLYAMRK